MKHYTMKQIWQSYTPEKRKSTSIWAMIFSRPLSFPVTYVLINLGASANLVSILSVFVAIAACVLLSLGGVCSIVGVFLFLFWDVMDCVDGNIARVKGTSSLKGEYMDAISGYTAPAFIYLALGIAAYNEFGHLYFLDHWIIVLGAVASISDILSRIVYQKYLVAELKVNGKKEEDDGIEKQRASGIMRFLDLIMKNLTYSSFFMPLLVIAKFTGHMDVLTVLYAFYSVVILIGTYVVFIRKAYKNLKG